jgi:hypothetical protein
MVLEGVPDPSRSNGGQLRNQAWKVSLRIWGNISYATASNDSIRILSRNKEQVCSCWRIIS